MARTTPRVEQEVLVLPTNRNTSVAVGSQQWYSWLSDEANSSFFFVNDAGSFTARKERRKRGGWYWIGYRSRGGKLAKTYIGRSEDLTLERLREVTSQLAGQVASEKNRGGLPQTMIAAKFAPPPLSMRMGRTIERTALLERLDKSLRVKLTLVTAAAGFGKTTLLNMWYEAHSRSHPLTWITLDERDNDPTRFWGAIWSALRGEQREDISTLLYSTPQMSIETILAVLLNSRPHGVLILDDYHLITNPLIHKGMDLLLTHLLPGMHIIISSRSEPPLSLGRARMYGEMVELRADDLRLHDDEIERFFREVIALDLTAEERKLLQQRTEGWVAGLHLAGLALRGQQRPGEALERFTGSQRSLFDYFAEEVFARQPEEVQDFLLATAFLPELSLSLCAAVLGEKEQEESAIDARSMLDYIERANIFVVALDEQRQYYRYHALFSEFLREKLRQASPEMIPELQRRTASWYEQQGMKEEAIEYALASRDNERAIRLIEQIGEELLWRRGEVRRLLTWIQQLPGIGQGERPYLDILYIWATLLNGQFDSERVEPLLELIERQAETHEGIDAYRGDIAALRARIAGFHDDLPNVIAYSQEALQYLPKERALLRADVAFGTTGAYKSLDENYRMLAEALHISQSLGSMRTAMFTSRYLALICMDQGRMTEAEAVLRQALYLAGGDEKNAIAATGIVHVGLAELLYERNELAEAFRHALLGIELGEKSGEIKAVVSGCCILALIFAARGEYERSWQKLWRTERITQMASVSWLKEAMAGIAIRLSLAQGDIGGAKRALQQIDLDADGGSDQVFASEDGYGQLLLATVWLAEGKYRAIVELLEPAIQLMRREKRMKNALAMQALLAIALSHLRERQRAVQLLSETLTMAGPEGYVRIFLDIGAPMQEALQRIEVTGSARRYAQRLMVAPERRDGEQKSDGGLSEREQEVLQLVAAGMSNQEIADVLVVAVSTVKVHVRHICHKLDVQKRIQAVTKAREMGIV